MADRDLAVQAAQLLLGEDLCDEAQVAEDGQPAVVGDGDARGLLAAVLEREEAEIADTRDIAVGGADAEDAAHQSTAPTRRMFGQPSCAKSSGEQARRTEPYGAVPSAQASRPLHAPASATARSSPPSPTS